MIDIIKLHIQSLPMSQQGIFSRAFNNKGYAQKVKAKCLDCSCFKREEVTRCNVVKCPLHSVRPYQNEKLEEIL